MREFCTKWWKRITTVDMLFIGVLTLLASLFASWLKQFPGFSLFGALIIALLIGMIIQFPIRSAYVGSNDGRKAGVKDAAGLISNKLLRLGIILLGFKLNLAVLFTQGIKCLPIAAVVVTLTIIVCYAIARKLGKRARVMLRVTVGVHAGGHEYISTAHEDQKFGVPLLAFYCTFGDILSNLIWCGMMIWLSFCAIRGLAYAKTQMGAARNMRWFHIGVLCFAFAEYLLWTAGCFWPDTSPTSPTFWCDMLLTFAILGLLPATRRAVEA